MVTLKFTNNLKGPNGAESAAWAAAAGMINFETFYGRCRNVLLDVTQGKPVHYEWPPDVLEVNYGFADPIKRPGT